ncbi:ribosome biogenesis protein [Candidatus Woesearchaeota archaeon]|nr:ribosome biogenesis protein [Candidatus Woesearchaeota archaeon]
MTNQILKCLKCDKYTLEEDCSICSNKCVSTKPAKFRHDDKYGFYRLLYKKKTMN